MMNKEQKKKYIENMTTQFDKTEAVIVTHYQGLTVTQLDDLRNKYLPKKRSDPDNNKQILIEYLNVIGWNIPPDNIIYNYKGDKYITSLIKIKEIQIAKEAYDKLNINNSYF